MNGLDAVEILLVEDTPRDAELTICPVVMVTSSTEYPDIQSAYALGVNSYVIKPVQFEAFIAAISRLGIYWLLVNHT